MLSKDQVNSKPILIVEGEKAADAATIKYPDFTVISWSGGASGFKKSNWGVLKDKEVVIWPDNDEPGVKAATGIKEILEAGNIAKSCNIIDCNSLTSLPTGWDLADDLPEYVEQYEIDSLLFAAGNLNRHTHKTQILNQYLTAREKSMQEDLERKVLTLTEYLTEYLTENSEISEILKIEKEFVKTALEKNIKFSKNNAMHTHIAAKQAYYATQSKYSLIRFKAEEAKTEQEFDDIVKNVVTDKLSNLNKDHTNQKTKIPQPTIQDISHMSVIHAKKYIDDNKTHFADQNEHKVKQVIQIAHIFADIMAKEHIKGNDIHNEHIIKTVQTKLNQHIQNQQTQLIHHNQIAQQHQMHRHLSMEM